MTDPIYKLKTGYSIAADGDYVAVGNPTSFLSGSSILRNKGSVEIFKYSKTTDLYNPYFIFYKYINPDGFPGYLSADTSSADTTYINADTSSVPILGLNLELDLGGWNPIVYDDSYGVSVDVSGSVVVVGNPYYRFSLIDGSNLYTGSCVDIYDLLDYSSSYVSGTVYYPKYSIANTFDNDEYSTFGESVSIYENKLVIGSSKNNAVYIYTKSLGVWNHYQTLNGTNYFGGSVKIDPSGSNRIVVGNKSTGSAVYVYEYNLSSNLWQLSDTLDQDRNLTGSLNFINTKPYFPEIQPSGSNYGNSISIYGNTIIVGSPNDMYYYEWSGSTVLRNRGAVYFWKKCSDVTNWTLLQKSFGNENLLKSNNFGYSVDIYKENAIATNTKDIYQFSSSYIINTINKRFDCNPDDNIIDTLGQFVLFTSSLSSSEWQIDSVITKKKQYGYPYTTFGYSCAITDNIVSIGSPLFLVNPIEITSSLYDTINGYSYIYNFNDFVTNYHIGNVFYRDGKIILSNSGSIFDNLLKNRSNPLEPKYDIEYKSNVKLYEKQVLCRIESGEFNYSTNPTSLIPNTFDFDIDNNKSFDFTDLDLIFKYINYQINGTYNWWDYMTFTNEEQSLFNLYSVNYNISSSYTNQYNSNLISNYNSFDIDGNNKVNFNDMYILWKYFNNNLNQTELFKYVEPKSTRKTLQQIVSYIEQKTGKFGGKLIKKDFFGFNYSSSIDPTGSYLAPYITTVGLYSGADLVAVAKLGMPIKNTGELPLNILVKWDI
jgi:hypothetical protein